MRLSCFLDYVGLVRRNGVYDQPGSGQFVNTLPGININNVDRIADSEQGTWKTVWADVQVEAASRFYLDVLSRMRGCYKLDPDCDYEALICTNKEILATAWKYLLGVQLMSERMFSERLNRFTLVDRKQAEELRAAYQSEYEVYLEQAIQLLDTTDCDLCCGGNPEYVTWLP